MSVTHKVRTGKYDALTWCGLFWTTEAPRTFWWSKTTCKKCLSRKPAKTTRKCPHCGGEIT